MGPRKRGGGSRAGLPQAEPHSLLHLTELHADDQLGLGRHVLEHVSLEPPQHVRPQQVVQLLDLVFFGDVCKLLQEALQVAARESGDKSPKQGPESICRGSQDWGRKWASQALPPARGSQGGRLAGGPGGPSSPGPAQGSFQCLPVPVSPTALTTQDTLLHPEPPIWARKWGPGEDKEAGKEIPLTSTQPSSSSPSLPQPPPSPLCHPCGHFRSLWRESKEPGAWGAGTGPLEDLGATWGRFRETQDDSQLLGQGTLHTGHFSDERPQPSEWPGAGHGHMCPPPHPLPRPLPRPLT